MNGGKLTENMKTLLPAPLGSVSTGTLNPRDLIPALTSELEWQIGRNGEFLSKPENFAMRDRLASLVGEAQDSFDEAGEEIREDVDSSEIINDLCDALSEFAKPFCWFGSHPGDGSDFGYWPCFESIDDLEHGDSEASLDGDDRKEVNDHGNVTVWSNGKSVLEIV